MDVVEGVEHLYQGIWDSSLFPDGEYGITVREKGQSESQVILVDLIESSTYIVVDSNIELGTCIHVSGGNFAPNNTIQFVLDGTIPLTTSSGAISTGTGALEEGTFCLNIPDDVTPGEHFIGAFDEEGNYCDFKVVITEPGFSVNLAIGFNLISLHATGDLRDLLPTLSDSSEIEGVMVYDRDNGHFIHLIPDNADNPVYIMSGNEGLIVYSNIKKTIGFPSVTCPGINLSAGFNLVGFGCPPDNTSAFDVLNAIGSDNVLSIQRYNTETGAFETASFDESGQVMGVDFSIVPGEGYFVYMK